jgi:hypothetical protein
MTEKQMRGLLDAVDDIGSKEDAIALIAASAGTRAQRATAFRMWCQLYNQEARRPDLARCTARRRRQTAARLFE